MGSHGQRSREAQDREEVDMKDRGAVELMRRMLQDRIGPAECRR